MNYKIKSILQLLILLIIPLIGIAQNNLETQIGYQVSKENGAISNLTKWSTISLGSSKDPVVNPQEKQMNQMGLKANSTYSPLTNDYDFYGGIAYKGNNVPYASVTDNNGNTYVTGGSTNINQPSGDFFTLKVGPNGENLWENREEANMYAVEYGMQITIDNNGDIIVSGLKWNGSDMDIRVIKYSPDGTKLWESTFDNGADGLEIPNALVTGTDGSVYITGLTWSGDSVNYVTIKYNNNGVEQWHTTENPGGTETWNEATAIAVDANDNVIVTGYSPNADGWLNYHTIKYSMQGTKLWEQAYNYTNTDPDNASDVTNSVPHAITTDADGNIYVTGTFDTYLRRIGTIKYNNDGVQQWVQTYRNSTEETQGLHIAINNNKVYVEGNHSGGFSDDGTVLISYNIDGTQNWVEETSNLIQVSNGALSFDSSGNIIVAASGMTPGAEEWLQDMAARAYKYSTEGNLLGQSAFVISTTDGTASMGNMAGIGVDAADNVYFSVASFYTEDGTVFETVKSTFANTSPDTLWSAIYTNQGSPAATMLNSLPDGNGNTISTGSFYDYSNDMLNNNYFVTKHNSTGDLVWDIVYNTANGYPAEGINARTDNQGNIYVCLLPSYEAYPPSLKIIKLSPEGNELWSTDVEVYSPSIYVMEPQADGSVYLGGTAYETETSQTASFIGIKLNSEGSEEWKTYMPGIAGNNIFSVSAGKVNSNGELILTGKHGSGTFLSQNASLTAIKFNADGSAGWITPVTVDGESSTGTDMYIATDGSIYINGYTQNTTSYNEDILTAKISATGEVLWYHTYGDASTTERSYTVKPFSNGDIAVVGYSLVATTGDIHNVLIKYNADGTLLWNFASENMYYYNDFYIDGSDVCYIMDQVIIDPFPHKISQSYFPISALLTVDVNGENSTETFFIGPEYAEFYGERLVPHSDDRLLLAGSVSNQDFYKGTYFFETEQDGSLGLSDDFEQDEIHNVLGQNFPNPVQESTKIPFTLVNGGKVTLNLYSTQGKFVKNITTDVYPTGTTVIDFNTTGLTTGIYFYQIETNGFKQAKKMVVK